MIDLRLIFLGVVTLFLLLMYAWRGGRKVNAPRVGISPGFLRQNIAAAKQEFFLHGHLLVEHGYREVKDTC